MIKKRICIYLAALLCCATLCSCDFEWEGGKTENVAESREKENLSEFSESEYSPSQSEKNENFQSEQDWQSSDNENSPSEGENGESITEDGTQPSDEGSTKQSDGGDTQTSDGGDTQTSDEGDTQTSDEGTNDNANTTENDGITGGAGSNTESNTHDSTEDGTQSSTESDTQSSTEGGSESSTQDGFVGAGGVIEIINTEKLSFANADNTVTFDYSKYDLEQSSSVSKMTYITLKNTTAEVRGQGATVSGSTVTVNNQGTYFVSGTLIEGQIRIAVTDTQKVRLILNGVTITNSSDSPIYAESGDKVIITLAEGSQNYIRDNDTSTKTDTDTRGPAAIYSCVSLTLNGSGSLTVSSSYNNSIGTKKTLKVVGGSLDLTAQNAGLKGNNAVGICGGNITVNSQGDSIKSEEIEDTTKGIVFISGGVMTLTSNSDGISGSINTVIIGGEINITTTGTEVSTEEVTTSAQSSGRPGMGGNMGGNMGGGSSVSAPASKGIKAGSTLYISGGNITVNSTGHAIHSADNTGSSGDISITGNVVINITSQSGKGIQGHGSVYISGGVIDIKKATEGIESKRDFKMSAGSVKIYATDDGINVSGSEYSFYMWGGSINIVVSSGDTDGIDSNNNLYITGGVTTVYSSSGNNGMSGALDVDRTVSVSGGSLVILGTSSAPISGYSGKSVSISGVSLSAGAYTVKNSSGSELFSFEVTTQTSSAWICSDTLTQSSGYSLYRGASLLKSW